MAAGDIEPADPGEGLVPVLLVEQGADDGLARGRGLHPLLHTDPRHHDQEAPAELVGRRAVLGCPRPSLGAPRGQCGGFGGPEWLAGAKII